MNNQNNFINNLFNNFNFRIYYQLDLFNKLDSDQLIRLNRRQDRIGLYNYKADKYVSMYKMIKQFPENRGAILEVFVLYIYKIISYHRYNEYNFNDFIGQIQHIIEVVYNNVNSMLYRIVNIGDNKALYNLMLEYLYDHHEEEVDNHTYKFNTHWHVHNHNHNPVQIVNTLIELICYEFYFEEWYGDFNEDDDAEAMFEKFIDDEVPDADDD